MCSTPSMPAATKAETPPSPETVKRVESDVIKARQSAKEAAVKRYGVSGTNVTQGRLSGTETETKKSKLGGAS